MMVMVGWSWGQGLKGRKEWFSNVFVMCVVSVKLLIGLEEERGPEVQIRQGICQTCQEHGWKGCCSTENCIFGVCNC